MRRSTSLCMALCVVGSLICVCFGWQPRQPSTALHEHLWEPTEEGFTSFLQLREVRFTHAANAPSPDEDIAKKAEKGKGTDSKGDLSPSNRRIRGKIKLNQQLYNTICDCENSDTTHSCRAPRRLRVHQEDLNRKMGYSRTELKRILGSPRKFQLFNARTSSFACLDGRNDEPVLATPGGEYGELLNALSVVEEISGQQFTEEKVLQVLRKYLNDITGTFFACTDEQAIRTLERNIHVNGQANVVVGLKLDDADVDYREEILKVIVKPQHQGDYFLKAVLADPKRFYMRRGLVHAYLRAFYQVLWDRESADRDGTLLANKIKFQIYQGKPKARAWINFRANHHCEREHRAPAFNPKNKVWANHPQAVTVFRKKLARFLLTAVRISLPWKTLTARLDRRGRRTMEVVAEILAASSNPFYTVIVE